MPATRTQLSQAYPIGSRIDEDGRLQLGGCDAVELAREFGTPAYVVVEDDLRARAQTFVEAFRARTKDFDVLFASKAFPCTAIYRVLAQEGIACDVASGGELALALRGGFDPARIYMHGNAKSVDELRFARESGVGHIVIDNADEIARLEAVVGDGAPQPVLLRVTPDVRGRTNDKISTGQADSKFGFSMADAPAAIQRTEPAQPSTSSACTCTSARRSSSSSRSGWRSRRSRRWATSARTTSAAGSASPTPPSRSRRGSPTTSPRRSTRSTACSAPASGSSTSPAARSSRTRRSRSTPCRASSATSRPGSPSTAGCPTTCARCSTARSTRRRSPTASAAARPSRLTGKHCESGDVIVREVELADPRVGDVIVTPATGAYGHAMANNYNGVPRPPVIMVSHGDARVVVRRETYDDLFARDVD